MILLPSKRTMTSRLEKGKWRRQPYRGRRDKGGSDVHRCLDVNGGGYVRAALFLHNAKDRSSRACLACN